VLRAQVGANLDDVFVTTAHVTTTFSMLKFQIVVFVMLGAPDVDKCTYLNICFGFVGLTINITTIFNVFVLFFFF